MTTTDFHIRPFNRLKDCRHGKMLYNQNDQYVGRSFDEYGEFSEGEVDLFRKIVRAGDVVIDVGANIGAHTIFFANATAPGGAVIAFEPQRMVYQTLCANIALNSLMNVFAERMAVGDTPGSLLVPDLDPRVPLNFGGLSIEGNTSGVPVPVVTLDATPLRGVRLIKVDVEGMEAAVLRGARQTIARLKPILFVENDRDEKSHELIAVVHELGYDAWWHYAPLFNPNNFAGNPKDVFDGIVSHNMLCIPRGEDASIARDLKPVG